MYTSLMRDESVVPIVQRLLGNFYGYLRAIQDTLMAGRGLRGRAARRTRAAIGHALAFPTWRSLTREQGLSRRRCRRADVRARGRPLGGLQAGDEGVGRAGVRLHDRAGAEAELEPARCDRAVDAHRLARRPTAR